MKGSGPRTSAWSRSESDPGPSGVLPADGHLHDDGSIASPLSQAIAPDLVEHPPGVEGVDQEAQQRGGGR